MVVGGGPSIAPPIVVKALSKECAGQLSYAGALGRASRDVCAGGTVSGSQSGGSAWGSACFLTG